MDMLVIELMQHLEEEILKRTGDNTVNLQTVTIQMNKTELQSK